MKIIIGISKELIVLSIKRLLSKYADLSFHEKFRVNQFSGDVGDELNDFTLGEQEVISLGEILAKIVPVAQLQVLNDAMVTENNDDIYSGIESVMRWVDEKVVVVFISHPDESALVRRSDGSLAIARLDELTDFVPREDDDEFVN